MKRIFQEFDQVRIINLPERTDRRRAVLRELSAIGIGEVAPPISFFEARRPPSAAPGAKGPNGALISHREVIRDALAAGAESLLILEDDIFFRRPSPDAIAAVLEAMRRESWDLLYCGYLDPAEADLTGRGALASWEGRVIGGHFCGMNRAFMARMVDFMDSFGLPGADGVITNPTHRDGAFNLFIERNPDVVRKLAVPCLAVQRSSRTDLHKNRFLDRTPIVREAVNSARAFYNQFRKR